MRLPFELKLEFGDDQSMPILKFLLWTLGIGFVIGMIAARIFLH